MLGSTRLPNARVFLFSRGLRPRDVTRALRPSVRGRTDPGTILGQELSRTTALTLPSEARARHRRSLDLVMASTADDSARIRKERVHRDSQEAIRTRSKPPTDSAAATFRVGGRAVRFGRNMRPKLRPQVLSTIASTSR
jgi:hypothetical protein